MNDIEFNKVKNQLKFQKGTFLREIYFAIERKMLIHDLKSFEKMAVIDIISDKIALRDLELQKSSLLGLEFLLDQLLLTSDAKVRQFLCTTDDSGFMLITSLTIDRIIGCYKDPDRNIEIDIEYQKRLKEAGHSNKDIFLIENGHFRGDIFNIGVV